MTREEIPYDSGYEGECMMCKIKIAPDDKRVSVYEAASGRRTWLGLLCPTCAKIGKAYAAAQEARGKAEEKPVDAIPDIEEMLNTYQAGLSYAAKKKIKVSDEDLSHMAISVYIQSRR